MRALRHLDHLLRRMSAAGIGALAACGVALVGAVDYGTGYEISLSLFYLGPVALAAWYGGRWAGVLIAIASCVGWYVADFYAGNHYSHPAIAVWNSLVRFGFFLTTGLLLTALRDAYLDQQHMARTDALTGLYGRRAFEAQLEHDLALAKRRGSPFSLAYVDLDDFKAVNDRYGHSGGDGALRTLGRVLKSALRQTDTAARLGGDEFALALPDTDREGARQVIANLADELQEAFARDGIVVTCSIGVVTVPPAGASPAAAVSAADALMYEVKRNGKGAILFRTLPGARDSSKAADGEAPSGR